MCLRRFCAATRARFSSRMADRRLRGASTIRAPLLCFSNDFVAPRPALFFFLTHPGPVRAALVAAVVALLDGPPRFFLFFLLRVDDLFVVRIPIFERFHLGRALCLPAAL